VVTRKKGTKEDVVADGKDEKKTETEANWFLKNGNDE
jgi:hypothetical protein